MSAPENRVRIGVRGAMEQGSQLSLHQCRSVPSMRASLSEKQCRGLNHKPPKFPSLHIQSIEQRIQVNHLAAIRKGVMSAQQQVPPCHRRG